MMHAVADFSMKFKKFAALFCSGCEMGKGKQRITRPIERTETAKTAVPSAHRQSRYT